MTEYKTTLPSGQSIHQMNDNETWLIYNEIFGEGIYDRCGVHLHDDATVVDIGGNIGLFMLYATGNHRRINLYSYEPIPETFGVLKANRALVDDEHQVQLFNMGVWKEKTSMVFRHLPRFSCSSTMCPDDSEEQHQRAVEFTLNAFEQHPNKFLAGFLRCLPRAIRIVIAKTLMRFYAKKVAVECELTTISDIIRDNALDQIDYLKLDAEGAEIEILRSIKPEEWAIIQQIAVETHRGDESMNEVERILAQEGFQTANSFSQSSPADKMVYGTRRMLSPDHKDTAHDHANVSS